jgi:hypothetical protein
VGINAVLEHIAKTRPPPDILDLVDAVRACNVFAFATVAALAACGDASAVDAAPVRIDDAAVCGARPDWCDEDCANVACGDPSIVRCECHTGIWSECPVGANCNPISQTGCADGQKCAYILCEPGSYYVYRVGCSADGDAGVGAACTEPTVANETDECASGGHCYEGVCRAVCTTLNPRCETPQCCAAITPRVDVCIDGEVCGVDAGIADGR